MNPWDRLEKLQKRQRAEFERSVAIAKEIRERPRLSYAEIGAKYGVTPGRIGQIAMKFKVHRKRGPKARENG